MLKTLTVMNFALIEQAVVEFTGGLNILTGETGAGKSILIDAFGMILGNRSSVDHIRKDTEALRVEAVFDISDNPAVFALLNQQDIACEEDGTLIVNRRFTRTGKNTITVNGYHVTLNFLRQLGELLVDMHGQHENQALLRSDTHLLLLDSHNQRTKDILEQYQGVYSEWLRVSQKLIKSQNESRERAQRLDLLRWQIDEIAAAHLKPNEDAELEQEMKILANAEKITALLSHAYSLLSDDKKGYIGIIAGLAEIKRNLETVVRYNSNLQAQLNVITDALYQLEDCSRDIREYYETVDYNPDRLAFLHDRLDTIYKLSKKYGPTAQEILDYYGQAEQEFHALSSHDEMIEELTVQKENLEKTLAMLANELTSLRKQSATLLASEICGHLVNLGMPKAQLNIRVASTGKFTIHGCDEVEFLFSANAGEELKAVHKVASGGELSRLALAIKTVCAARDAVGTMVFDEIDTGIGGQTAQMVAEKIAMVAASKQVLCITHLPQIAVMADSHLYIEKCSDEDRTITQIASLNKQKQVIELARMIAGTETEVALDHAAHMLSIAASKKDKWKNKA